jgi:hypothetical protein
MGRPKFSAGSPFHTVDFSACEDRRVVRYPGRVLIVTPSPDEFEPCAEYLLSRRFCVLMLESPAAASRLASEVWLSAVIADERVSGREDRRGFARLKHIARARAIRLVILTRSPEFPSREGAEGSPSDLVRRASGEPNALGELIASLKRTYSRKDARRRISGTS